MIGDATYTDYGLRIIRGNGGADTTSTITHRGTGVFLIETIEAAPIVFNTTAAERMRITTGGSLLIGDTTQGYNPQTQGYLFGVKSNTTQAFISIAKSGQTLDSGGMIVGLDTTTGYVWMRENVDITFGTNNSTKVTIAAGGNVGIGTTAPSGYLDIKGLGDTAGVISLQLRSGNSSNNVSSNQITLGYANTADYRHAIKTRHNSGAASGNSIDFFVWKYATDAAGTIGTQHVMSLDGPNVGIGLTSPGHKLDVTGDINFSSTLKYGGTTVIGNSSTDVYINARVLYSNSTSNDGMYINYNSTSGGGAHLRFFANSTNERMRIDANSGNVGIGTTAPAEKLAVVGNIRSAGNVIASVGLGYGNYISMRHDDVNGYITITRTVYAGHLILEPYGNVGIGTTTPTVKLHVSGGAIRIQGSGDPNNSLRFDDTGGTSRNAMFVSSSNYLVVGNTNYAGIQLIHTGSAPGANNIDNGASRYYGTDQTYYLAEPNKWLAVRINSVDYVMPMYQV